MPSSASAAACAGSGGARARSTWTSCAGTAAPCRTPTSPSPTPSCQTATSGCARSPTSMPSRRPVTNAPKSITVHDLLKMKQAGERIVVLTCYDALFARLLDASGVDILLLGDSVNQVLAGAETTLLAPLEPVIYPPQ